MKKLPEITLVDVRTEGVPEEMLQRALGQFGDSLLNVRSTTWRTLTAEERDRPQIKLLQTHPTLMKRPLIERDGKLYLSWSKETQSALGVS